RRSVRSHPPQERSLRIPRDDPTIQSDADLRGRAGLLHDLDRLARKDALEPRLHDRRRGADDPSLRARVDRAVRRRCCRDQSAGHGYATEQAGTVGCPTSLDRPVEEVEFLQAVYGKGRTPSVCSCELGTATTNLLASSDREPYPN